MTGDQVPLLLSAGLGALAIASVLWAVRVSDGARGATKRYHARARDLEEKLARADSVFGAHPGVILVWEDGEEEIEADNIVAPQLYGSPMALAGLLKYTDDAISMDPSIRIIEGLADLEARDAVGSGRDTSLRLALYDLRKNGTPFSLTIIGRAGLFLEADGRTAGARAVVWLTDSSTRHREISLANGKIEEANQLIARDPTAFLDMLGKSPFPAWRVSGVGKLQWANPAYLKAVGATDLKSVLERQVMLDSDTVEQLRKTITTGEELDETRTVVIDGGESRSMRILSFPLSGGASGMAFDVTEQETARKTLDLHVQAHAETLNHVADAVAIFGKDRRLIFHNNAFAEMWGLEEGLLLENPTHGQLLDRLRERRKLPARTDYAAWRADELSHYLDISGIAEDTWALPDGRTISITRQRHPLGGLLVLFKDITGELDLKTRYNALIETQSATLDTLHEACVVFGGDGRLRLSNKSFQDLWNLDADLLKDQPDFDTVIDACIPLFHNRDIWSTIKGHVTDISPAARQRTSGEMPRSDGTTLTYLTHPLPDGNTLIAFANITATRRVETALKERAEAFETADRLKTEFVQNVSYQLRSPLTTILGYAEFLESQRHGELSERQLDYVNSILAASNHLSELIENILDLALIEAGRMDLDLSDVDLTDIIEDSVDMAVSTATDTQVSVKADIRGELGTIRADDKRIRQVVFNLLSNALRFTEPGGEIIISADRTEDMARITVRDNGRGIDEDRQAESFDSFTSGDNRGAGLGLALVRHFVELHGGRVGMRSTSGEGTEVVCWLPVSAARLLAGREATAAEMGAPLN
ncbi:MAG: ATP-binding protein [Pseudomonadota bacterium]